MWRIFFFLIPFAVQAIGIDGEDASGNSQNVRVNSSGQLSLSHQAGENQTADTIMTQLGPWEFEEIAASATDQTMGAVGGVGDYLSHCIVSVVTAATGTFGIEDGTNAAFDNISMTAANTTIGVYNIPIGANATTAAGWEITTGAGATAACFGRFTD